MWSTMSKRNLQIKLIRISQLCNTKKKKRRKYGVFTMDLAGIEPASESLSLAASPITVAVLTFPPQHAHRQAYCFSSFMIHLPGQSLPGKVSHKVDTRLLKCECNRTDGQHLGCHYWSSAFIFRISRYYAVRETADGFHNFKTPVETSTSPNRI